MFGALSNRMRVVCLTCSNTEIVCALGGAKNLVGVDDHSDFPEDVVLDLPRVGPDLSIDIERVASLKPDMVLASLTVPGHEKVVAELADSGLPYLAFETITLEDTYDDIMAIGEVLGLVDEAQTLVSGMQGVISVPRPPLASGPKILVEWWPKPVIAAGKDSWITDLIAAAGGQNALGDWVVKSSPVTDEQVREIAPDAVVIAWCGVPASKYKPQVVYDREGWSDVPAVKNRRVFCVPEAFLGRPGPRLIQGLHSLAEVVVACQDSD